MKKEMAKAVFDFLHSKNLDYTADHIATKLQMDVEVVKECLAYLVTLDLVKTYEYDSDMITYICIWK